MNGQPQARVLLATLSNARVPEADATFEDGPAPRTWSAFELGTLRVAIEGHRSSYRAVRGRTVIAALCDEVAFWRSVPTNRFGSADPHAEGRARTLRRPSPTPARASRHFRAAVRAQYGGTRSALACSGRGGWRSGYRWVRRCRRHPRASGIASRPAPPGTGMGSRCGSEHRSAGSGAWPRAACAWG